MIKEFFNHPEPFHSHSGHVGMDSRGESIKLSIFKLATVLGDHVSNTDIHVQSSITDEDIDDIVDVPSDSAQKATEYVTSEFLKQMYYTKMDIDQMGFLKQIPDGFATEDYVNDRIRTQKEELEKYAASLIGDYVKPDDYNIFQNTVNSKLNTLTDKYVSLDQRVTGLSSDVSSLKSDVSSLKSRVSVLEKNGTGGSGTGKPGDGDNDNPGSGGTGGNSDSHKKTTVTYMPTVTKTTKGSYEIGTLYVDGEEATIWGKDNATTVINGGDPVDPIKCATVQVYKATGSNANRPDKPGSFSTDDTHLRITEGPVGWYKTPQLAANELNKKDVKLWVSIITLYSDGTNSGWSLPQEYVNVNNLIQQATNDAQEYYKAQLESADSRIKQIIADAENTLKELNDRIDKGDEGNPDTSWREKIEQKVSSIDTYGWTKKPTGGVMYADALLDAINGEIEQSVAETDGNNNVKKAIQKITSDFIIQNVYDYTKAEINATTIQMSPTGIVLEALEKKNNYQGSDVNKALSSAVIDIVKDKITLSVAQEGKGAQFVLKVGDKESQANLDVDKFVISGDLITKTVNANGISIQNENGDIVAGIDSIGEARFGNGTTIFEEDGSGITARGNIRWDENGSLWITGLMTDKTVNTEEEWNTITEEFGEKNDSLQDVLRQFQIVNPNKATSYYIPMPENPIVTNNNGEVNSKKIPEVVFLPSSSGGRVYCLASDGQGTTTKWYDIPNYMTAGTRIKITLGASRSKTYWAYTKNEAFNILSGENNPIDSDKYILNLFNEGVLICADPRIFTQTQSTFNVRGRNFYDQNYAQYMHGRFSINGATGRMLWLMPGQTVELLSQIETINGRKCLVWKILNASDFTPSNTNIDFNLGGTNQSYIAMPGISEFINFSSDNSAWYDKFIANDKIDIDNFHKDISNSDASIRYHRRRPRLYIIKNIANDGNSHNGVTTARFGFPANYD